MILHFKGSRGSSGPPRKGFAVTADPSPLTAERIRRHIGDPRSIRWVELSSMTAQGLPIFEVVFAPDNTFEIRGTGY